MEEQDMTHRELSRSERKAIRKLVTSMCANYTQEYGCLLLDNPCYMLDKCWTGSYCKYFCKAVLPLNPELEAVLLRNNAETRSCALCGNHFRISGNQTYCSETCSMEARRKRQRDYLRRKQE